MRRVIAGMTLAVVNHHLFEIEGRDALQAGDVDAKLVRVRAALVVGIDAAHRAEMMLGDARVEAVGGELVGAFEDPESVMGRSHRDPDGRLRLGAALHLLDLPDARGGRGDFDP